MVVDDECSVAQKHMILNDWNQFLESEIIAWMPFVRTIEILLNVECVDDRKINVFVCISGTLFVHISIQFSFILAVAIYIPKFVAIQLTWHKQTKRLLQPTFPTMLDSLIDTYLNLSPFDIY